MAKEVAELIVKVGIQIAKWLNDTKKGKERRKRK